jgi:hypothetical protein
VIPLTPRLADIDKVPPIQFEFHKDTFCNVAPLTGYILSLHLLLDLRVFENSVSRKIFGPKREEDGSWRKLHNDEFHSLCYSPNIVKVIKSRRMRWAGRVARMGEGRGVYRVLVGRPEGKKPLGRPRHRWEDNIKLDLREIEINGANWIQLAQDRAQWRACVNTVMNLRVP